MTLRGSGARKIRAAGRGRYSVVFGLREHTPETHPSLLDAVFPLPFPVRLSSSFGFLTRADALEKLSLKQDRMRGP